MWFITIVFITSLGTFNTSVAEHSPFKSRLECRAHYIKYKEVIRKSVDLAITTHLKELHDPKVTYQIQWIGCMHWSPKPMPKPRPKLKI
jgi:hypothetical protein